MPLNHKKIVVKVGSSTIFDGETGKVRRDRINSIAADIKWLSTDLDSNVILMSSGALATGREILKKAEISPNNEQILGAIGQIDISTAWAAALKGQSLVMGQLLLTPDVIDKSDIAEATIKHMFQNGIIPYINENIPIMEHYDNDGLAANVAKKTGCDLLILLSDVDGVYTANPAINPAAQKIDIIDDIDTAISKYGGGALSAVGTGGMITKLTAARLLLNAGVRTIIASGELDNPIRAITNERNGTLIKG